MKKVFEADIECRECAGTGLYVGMCERDGAAVVCSSCKGTGLQHFRMEYTEFTNRQYRNDVKKVYKGSFGFIQGVEDVTYKGKLIKFTEGGCSYADWLKGVEPKPVKTLYCPLRYSGQDWKSPLGCVGIGNVIDTCTKDKAKCWELYEKDINAKK